MNKTADIEWGRVCEDCQQSLLFFDCKYPFWYHARETPHHGEWVPDHDCAADASKATATDGNTGCGGAA